MRYTAFSTRGSTSFCGQHVQLRCFCIGLANCYFAERGAKRKKEKPALQSLLLETVSTPTPPIEKALPFFGCLRHTSAKRPFGRHSGLCQIARLRNATTDNLWASIEKTSGKQLAAIAGTFTDQDDKRMQRSTMSYMRLRRQLPPMKKSGISTGLWPRAKIQ